MFTFIHTSDIHIWDKHKYSINDSRLRKIEENLNVILNTAIKKEAKVIFIAGDIMNVYNPDEKNLKVFSKFASNCMLNNIKLRVVMGDHDTDGIHYSLESLKIVYDYKEDKMLKIFPNKIGSRVTVYTEMIEENVQAIYVPFQMYMNDAFIKARELRKKSCYNILVAHTGLDSSFYSQIAKNKKYKAQTEINNKYLSGYDYVALGDYHLFQLVGNKKEDNIYYSGSIIRIHRGEREDQKSFNLIKLKNNRTFVERILLDDIDFIDIKVNYNKIERILNKDFNKWNGKFIKNSFINLSVYGNIKNMSDIFLLKKFLYDKGASNVNEKIISTNSIEVSDEDIDDVPLMSLSYEDIIIKYCKKYNKKNKSFINFGIKKVKECL